LLRIDKSFHHIDRYTLLFSFAIKFLAVEPTQNLNKFNIHQFRVRKKKKWLQYCPRNWNKW